MNYPDGMPSGRGRISVEMHCKDCGAYTEIPGIEEPWGFFPDDEPECGSCGSTNME